MDGLVDALKSFNRKERYYVVRNALVGRDGFALEPEFGRRLSDVVGANMPVPPDAFVAIDYHLDWLYAALCVARGTAVDERETENPLQDPRHPDAGRVVTGKQEDIDLLVAFDVDSSTHLILVEAKGVTSWSRGKLRSKCSRLAGIFDADLVAERTVVPAVILWSPRESTNLDPKHLDPKKPNEQTNLPSWIAGEKFRRLQLDVPAGLRSVRRTNPSKFVVTRK